jgi:hypothetical protein
MSDARVCGECEGIPVQSVVVRVRGQMFEKMLCPEHLTALLSGSRPQMCDPHPRRIRRP